MKHLLACMLVTAGAVAFAPATSAAVLTFDDIGADGMVPAGYGGLDWSASSWSVYGAAQDPFNAHSGDYRAVSGFDDPDALTSIRASTPITFQGAWFAGLRGATVTFELYLNDLLVGRSATLDPTSTPTFLASGYAGVVDRIVVASPGQGSYVMDDFAFVPEPSTTALLLAGLVAAAGVGRRRTGADGRCTGTDLHGTPHGLA